MTLFAVFKKWNTARRQKSRRAYLVEELTNLYALQRHIDQRHPQIIEEVKAIDSATATAEWERMVLS